MNCTGKERHLSIFSDISIFHVFPDFHILLLVTMRLTRVLQQYLGYKERLVRRMRLKRQRYGFIQIAPLSEEILEFTKNAGTALRHLFSGNASNVTKLMSLYGKVIWSLNNLFCCIRHQS